jgi:GNAT superfamily N-acetyltransferase
VLFIRENSKAKSIHTDALLYREAQSADIKQMQVVRHLVKENTLSDPALVPDSDCEEYINVRGKGWVCETDGRIVGFAIADLKEHNIWALFIDPEFEKQGIGKKLHDMMLEWYFTQTQQTVWLGTAPGTRAEGFYRKAGWKDAGMHGKEVKFEMSFNDWVLNQPLATIS